MTGIYDLVAVLTHKGRSADSGHYVAWVKQESGQFSRLDHLVLTSLCLLPHVHRMLGCLHKMT